MPIIFSRGIIVCDESPNNITEIRTTSDSPIAYNTANQTHYKFDVTQSVGNRWIAQTNFFTLPSLTAGSVLFSNGSTIVQDNASLFYDDTNNRFGVGTATPSSTFNVVGLSKMNYSGAAAGSNVCEITHTGTGGGTGSHISVTGTTSNSNKGIYIRAANSTTVNVGLQINVDADDFNNLAIETISGAPSIFGGSIGIGTYTPGTALDIAGQITIQNRTSTPTIVGGYTAGGIACDLGLTTELGIASGVLGIAQQGATNGQVLTWVSASSKWLPTTVSSGGSGTVTDVSVVTANGISGSVATSTTTPAITLTLGAITPSSVNGLTITTTTGTLTVASGKTLTVSNSLTFTGTDSTTMTFPNTSATIARTDAGQTFTGVQTMTSPNLTTPVINGVSTGTGVASAATASTLVLRDSNINTKSNNNVDNFTTTATAAGTTTLTVSSSKIQEFTGSTTQTITLPVVSTLTTGHKYEIINNSTGNLTVNSSGANLVGIIGPNSAAHLTCDLITGTSAASWTFSIITNPIFGIPFMLGDGVNVLSVGSKSGIYIPFGYTILEWTIGSVNNTSGSIQLDLWVDSYANFPPTVADTITASAKPLFTSTTKGQSSTLTGWTTTIPADRWLYVNVDSVTSINQLSGTLKCRKL